MARFGTRWLWMCGLLVTSVTCLGQQLPAPAESLGAPLRFTAIFACTGPAGEGETSGLPEGFDQGAGYACASGALKTQHPGTAAYVARRLPPGQATSSAAAGMTVQYTPGANGGATVGWSGAPVAEPAEDLKQRLFVTVDAGGFALDAEGALHMLLPAAGAATGKPGSTDSSFGVGWAAPTPGDYEVGMLVQGDGSVLVSLMHPGTVNNSASFRLPGVSLPTCASPCGELGHAGGVQSFELGVTSAADVISKAGYVLGPSAVVGGAGGKLLLPQAADGTLGMGLLLRWFISAEGVSCEAGATGCMNVFAWVPPAYAATKANPWVIAMHGFNEDAHVVQVGYNNGGADVSDTLFKQGMVIVSMENVNRNCYGNAQCVKDVRNVVKTVQGALSLEAQPYVMADSMGGFQMLNSIAQGAVKPRAAVGFCINTDLAWDYLSGNAGAVIDAAYGVTQPTYSEGTAGFDPMLAKGEALKNLAAVPMLLISSPGDPIVNMAANTTALAAKLKKAGGHVQVLDTGAAGHVVAADFPGAAVAEFLNKY